MADDGNNPAAAQSGGAGVIERGEWVGAKKAGARRAPTTTITRGNRQPFRGTVLCWLSMTGYDDKALVEL